MRRTYNADFITLEDGTLLGISLGADYCAEHERGVEGINQAFGIPFDQEALFGIAKRTITKLPETLYWSKSQRKKRMHYALTFIRSWRGQMVGEFPLQPKTGLLEREEVMSMWDQEEFCIVVDKRRKKDLEEIYAAFQRLDISIGPSPGGPFRNGGIAICITSRFPEDYLNDLAEADEAYYNLQQDAKNTGIYEVLKEAKKGWYALSPKYWGEGEERILKFFLNPQEQHKYNHGWFTVEELKEWAEEKGPIIKEAKTV